jgi:hypothetical protein
MFCINSLMSSTRWRWQTLAEIFRTTYVQKYFVRYFTYFCAFFRIITKYITMHGMNNNIKLCYIMSLHSSSEQNCNRLVKLTHFTKILRGPFSYKLSKFYFQIGLSLYVLYATYVQQSGTIISINNNNNNNNNCYYFYYYCVATSVSSNLPSSYALFVFFQLLFI